VVLVQIPLTAFRWGILLRALGIGIPFVSLFHFMSISVMASTFLFGAAGGDAVRGVYAWRALGRDGARVAASVLADRVVGLLGLLSLALIALVLNWHIVRSAPALATLGVSLFLATGVAVAGIFVLAVATPVTSLITRAFSRWPRVAQTIVQLASLAVIFRSNPGRLAIMFGISLISQALTVLAVFAIAQASAIGTLGVTELSFATPVTLLVNTLPLTPNGIGVGEVAFDQICRWMEAVPSNATYSSIFFMYRGASMLASLVGLISLAAYRKRAPGPADDQTSTSLDSTANASGPLFITRSSTDR